MTVLEDLRWHDLECGRYAADLPMWRELAAAAGGPVLDVGAGAGRVTLDLARRGHAVVALDVDGDLLEALAERAGDLPVETVRADARSFHLGRRFPLILAPMQTVQLLGGASGRAAFLASAREHLEPGGRVAMAVTDELEPFGEGDPLPLPDVAEWDGTVFSSRPVALRESGGHVTIERLREIVDPHGDLRTEHNVIRLDRVSARQMAEEGRDAGLSPAPPRRIAATDDHVGSWVVILDG